MRKTNIKKPQNIVLFFEEITVFFLHYVFFLIFLNGKKKLREKQTKKSCFETFFLMSNNAENNPHLEDLRAMQSIPQGEIVGLQFGLVTSDDVNDWAVEELDKTNPKKNSIAPGSVTSQNLGAANNSLLCSTCGENNINCTGHDGKITLFQPVCNVNFFPLIQKVCSSLCYRCARVLLSNNQIKRHKNKISRPFQTANYKTCVQDIFKQSEKYKICWFPPDPAELTAAHKKKKKKKKQKRLPKKNASSKKAKTKQQETITSCSCHDGKKQKDSSSLGVQQTTKTNNIPLAEEETKCCDKKRKYFASVGDQQTNASKKPKNVDQTSVLEEKKEEERADETNEQKEEEKEEEEDVTYEQPHWLPASEAKQRGYCGARQPDMWILDQGLILRPVFYIDKKEEFNTLPVITPKTIERMLKFTDKENHALFGFNHKLSPLHAMMVSTLLVPSHNVRPLRTPHGAEDDLTKTLRLVQKYNLEAKNEIIPNLTMGLLRTSETKDLTPTAARKKMQHVQGPMSKTVRRKKVPIVPECLDSYFLVQRAVACLWDSKYSTLNDREFYRPTYALKQRFAPSKRSKGRVRQTMLGKRTNFCFRGVSIPNTNIEINQIGVPQKVMMHITVPEVVNDLNFNKMLQLVMNGQHKYPGCNLVERNGKQFLPSANFGGLRNRDIVHRHMQNGDPFVGNRQPSLHRFAIMGYHAVMTSLDVIESHLATTWVLNEDFDGDEKVGYVPQGIEERVEVETLMNVNNNLMKDGKLVIGFVQHAVLGAFKLTDERIRKVMLSKTDIENYICIGKNKECAIDFYRRWEAFNKCADIEISGREFMQLLLPSYNPKLLCAKNNNDNDVGTMNKTILNQCMGDTIEGSQDMAFAAFRIGFLTRILEAVCCEQGVSLTLDDVLIETPASIQTAADAILQDAIAFSASVHSTDNNSNNNVDEQCEEDICLLTDKYRQKLGKHVFDDLKRQNRDVGILDLVNSGAKGSEQNVVQITRSVGQQFNECNVRYKESTAHYYPNVLAKSGFVKRAYINGLNALEYFYQLRATRTGLIATGCNTGEPGYLYRKIYKSTEDERVMSDNSVRNAQGHIILFWYGFDTTFLHTISLRAVSMNVDEVVSKFIIFDTSDHPEPNCDKQSVDEIVHLLEIREQVIEIDQRIHIHIPVHFDKTFQCNQQQCEGVPVAFSTTRNKVLNMWNRLVKSSKMPCSPAHKLMFFENMATSVLFQHGVLKCPHVFHQYMEYVEHTFGTNVCPAGDPCGMKASQDSTQPITQTNLKRFHLTGQKTTIVNSVTRLREIVNLTENIEKPMMYVYLLPEYQKTFDPMKLIELRLTQVVTTYDDSLGLLSWQQHIERLQQQWDRDIEREGDDKKEEEEEEEEREKNKKLEQFVFGGHEEKYVCLTLYLNQDTMCKRKLIPREIAAYVKQTEALEMDLDNSIITYANVDEPTWWITIILPRESVILQKLQMKKKKIVLSVEEIKHMETMTPAMKKVFKAQKAKDQKPIPNSILSVLLQRTLVYDKQLLAGIEGIQDFLQTTKKVLITDEKQNGKLIYEEKPCYLTLGSNLQGVCTLPEVDIKYTTSNSIHQVFKVFGIEAAQLAIEHELMEAIQASNSSVAYQHVRLIAATMCFCGVPASLTFAAMTSKETATWYKRATFERSLESFLGAGISAHVDNLRGVSEAVMVGAKISLGTGGDFEMIYNPPTNDQLAKANIRVPRPQRIVFEKPDLDGFFNEPVYEEKELVIDLEEAKKQEAEKKHPTYHPKNRRGLFAKKNTIKYIQVYDDKDIEQAFTTPSSLQIPAQNQEEPKRHFGNELLFIPSSPKKRKSVSETSISYNNTKKKRLTALLEKQQQLAKRDMDLTNYFPRLIEKKKIQKTRET